MDMQQQQAPQLDINTMLTMIRNSVVNSSSSR